MSGRLLIVCPYSVHIAKARVSANICFYNLDALKTIFQINDSQVFAVGKKAKLLLGLTEDNHCIRHPANDYKKEFRPQFDLKIGQLYLHNQFVR